MKSISSSLYLSISHSQVEFDLGYCRYPGRVWCEAINDVSGTCADLFESMVLILGTCAIIGVKGSPVSWRKHPGVSSGSLEMLKWLLTTTTLYLEMSGIGWLILSSAATGLVLPDFFSSDQLLGCPPSCSSFTFFCPWTEDVFFIFTTHVIFCVQLLYY